VPVLDDDACSINLPDSREVITKNTAARKKVFNKKVSGQLSRISNEINKHYIVEKKKYSLEIILDDDIANDKKAINEVTRLLNEKNWKVETICDASRYGDNGQIQNKKAMWIRHKRHYEMSECPDNSGYKPSASSRFLEIFIVCVILGILISSIK
jgi:hypothetical protein